MSNLQNATLVLNSYDGCIATVNNSNLLWNNINLRTVLGDMYDKYDLFNLQLNSIAQSIPVNSIGASDNLRTLNLNISGLPFVNQTYSTANKCNTSETLLTHYKFNTTIGLTYIYNNNSIITFGKSQEMANIQINYKQVTDGTTPIPTNPYPSMVYQFSIYGIPKTDEHNKRIF
jgi:hypothetical protein